MAASLVVKLTAGPEAPERCSQAFTVAAIAAEAGVPTSVWLTGESSWFALPGKAATFELAEAGSLRGQLDTVLTNGTVTLCSQCAARRAISAGDVIAGVRLAGPETFVAEALADDVRALVY
jgi:predicted peroxiredoxin